MENRLSLKKDCLVCIDPILKEKDQNEYHYLRAHFCGRVLDSADMVLHYIGLSVEGSHSTVYVCGNIKLFSYEAKLLLDHVKVIREFSYDFEAESSVEIVSLGEVPINLHESAVYFRNCLGSDSGEKDYFDLLQTKHQFQALTESNKMGTSFRIGAYLSEVEADETTSKFHLLRCSTNLSGPTLAFTKEDREILNKVNSLAQHQFDQTVNLNHVLAQVYENSVTMNGQNKAKDHKAKIKSHSVSSWKMDTISSSTAKNFCELLTRSLSVKDKTKDMPTNGLIAFCTFYSSDIAAYNSPSHDRFDRNFKDASVLTQLRFRLKQSAGDSSLQKDFRVTLYPNSVLLVPLSTNRLYTHEIVPPTLPVGRFPTRLGYVVRCSKTKAVFRNGATFIEREGKCNVKLRRPTTEEFNELKRLYREENISSQMMVYPEIWFSMNEGDFLQPLVD